MQLGGLRLPDVCQNIGTERIKHGEPASARVAGDLLFQRFIGTTGDAWFSRPRLLVSGGPLPRTNPPYPRSLQRKNLLLRETWPRSLFPLGERAAGRRGGLAFGFALGSCLKLPLILGFAFS